MKNLIIILIVGASIALACCEKKECPQVLAPPPALYSAEGRTTYCACISWTRFDPCGEWHESGYDHCRLWDQLTETVSINK